MAEIPSEPTPWVLMEISAELEVFFKEVTLDALVLASGTESFGGFGPFDECLEDGPGGRRIRELSGLLVDERELDPRGYHEPVVGELNGDVSHEFHPDRQGELGAGAS